MIKNYLKKTARDNLIKIAACGVFFLAASFGLGYGLYNSLHESFEEQVYQNLDDMAADNSEKISKDMNAKIEALHSLGTIIRDYNEKDTTSLLSRMQEVNGIYNLKRIGFVFPDGTAYTTDGYVKNLKFRDFFKQSMQGKVHIQHRFIDAMGIGEPVNVISVPVSASNGGIKGVLFATYSTSVFQRIMDVNIYGGKGSSSVINNNGDILVTSTKGDLANENNLFEALVRNQAGTDFIQNLIKDMNEYKIGKANLKFDGGSYIVHYQPIALGDQKWYLLTSLPSNIAYEHISPITKKVNSFFIMTMGILLCLTGYIIWSYGKRRNRITALAYTDPLTKEGNFASVKEVYASLSSGPNYLVAMDIAKFSLVTLDRGREGSNKVILEIWQLIKNVLGKRDLACHTEHDEFVLCLNHSSQAELEKQLQSLDLSIQSLAKKLGIPSLRAYFGVVELTRKDDIEAHLPEAYQAKHDIKKTKLSNIGYFSSDNIEIMKEKEMLLAAVPEAFESERFEVWYQPKFSLATGELVGAESLVRWRDKEGRLIPPYKFIHLLETNGFISKLDEYMFTHVCQQQKKWLEEGRNICNVSINLSRISLFNGDVVENYSRIIREIGLDTKYIGIEITEGMIANKEEVIEPLKRFHLQGFKLLLDDFGSGYSSLSSFFMLPIDCVKFDKSLTDHICEDKGYRLVEGMVNFIDGLKLDITVEGVETQEQIEKLKQMNCSNMDIQGYVYAKPMPMEEFEAKYL